MGIRELKKKREDVSDSVRLESNREGEQGVVNGEGYRIQDTRS